MADLVSDATAPYADVDVRLVVTRVTGENVSVDDADFLFDETFDDDGAMGDALWSSRDGILSVTGAVREGESPTDCALRMADVVDRWSKGKFRAVRYHDELVDWDHIVTILQRSPANMSEADLNAAIRLHDRFPAPFAVVGRSATKVWRWRDVSNWLDARMGKGDVSNFQLGHPQETEIAHINLALARRYC